MPNMDNLNENGTTPGLSGYPLWAHLVILLLLLTGLGVLLLFGFFAFVTLSGQSFMVGVWNLLVTAAEGWALFFTTRHYVKGAQPISVIFFWSTLTGLGIPLIASGGCAFMADSFRIAG